MEIATTHPEELVKKKKPPACDSCKARRVLCLPTTDGTSCPRCIEKGIRCTTTPVPRGRPPKKHLGLVPPATPPSASESESLTLDSESSTSSSSGFLPSQDSTRFLELSPELVHHLFWCFAYLPQYGHPMFHGTNLGAALSSVSWQIHLLPPQLRVLAHCVVTLGASISFHPTILGPGARPESFNDRSVFTRGADLRSYGARRASMYRALSAQTLRLACEAGILLEPSGPNALSCFLIQFLENGKPHTRAEQPFINLIATDNEARSRPWAVAYLSHVRAIAASWDNTEPELYHAVIWRSFLMVEVLDAIQNQQPVLVSHNDQLLITGIETMSLQNLLDSMQKTMRAPKLAAEMPMAMIAMRPFPFHIIRLGRQLSETITGDFARRRPLDETAVAEFLGALGLLHSICTLVFDAGEPTTGPADVDAAPFFLGSPHTRSMQANVRSCALIMTCSDTTLVLALYRELARRAGVPPAAADGAAGRWAAEHACLLHRQVREMAGHAVATLARALPRLPSLPHLTHIYRPALVAAAQFCLAEAVPGRAGVIEAIADALKLVGYAWTLPPGLVERLEACIGTPRPPPLAFVEDAMLMDMFPAPNGMEMFMVPFGGEGIAPNGTQTR
ncbi:hypothetical protein FB451DRAFT_1358990 [Mycena latifolia]|nr:hypothetical protein FB451DRAFT_1358990 [Mycena latifolia]